MGSSRSYGSVADSRSHGRDGGDTSLRAERKGEEQTDGNGEWGGEGWSEGWEDEGWSQEAKSKAGKGGSVSSNWDNDDWGTGWEGTGKKKAGHSVENGWNDADLTARVD